MEQFVFLNIHVICLLGGVISSPLLSPEDCRQSLYWGAKTHAPNRQPSQKTCKEQGDVLGQQKL